MAQTKFSIRTCSFCGSLYDFLDAFKTENRTIQVITPQTIIELTALNVTPSNLCIGCRKLLTGPQANKVILKKKLVL